MIDAYFTEVQKICERVDAEPVETLINVLLDNENTI